MRKWILGLIIIMIFTALLRTSWKGEPRPSRLGIRIRKTLSMLAWILLSIYSLSFLYWLVTVVFTK